MKWRSPSPNFACDLHYTNSAKYCVFQSDWFQGGTDAIICSQNPGDTILIGHYAIEGHESPHITSPVRIT